MIHDKIISTINNAVQPCPILTAARRESSEMSCHECNPSRFETTTISPMIDWDATTKKVSAVDSDANMSERAKQAQKKLSQKPPSGPICTRSIRGFSGFE